jgi:hypothetical protein
MTPIPNAGRSGECPAVIDRRSRPRTQLRASSARVRAEKPPYAGCGSSRPAGSTLVRWSVSWPVDELVGVGAPVRSDGSHRTGEARDGLGAAGDADVGVAPLGPGPLADEREAARWRQLDRLGQRGDLLVEDRLEPAGLDRLQVRAIGWQSSVIRLAPPVTVYDALRDLGGMMAAKFEVTKADRSTVLPKGRKRLNRRFGRGLCNQGRSPRRLRSRQASCCRRDHRRCVSGSAHCDVRRGLR